MIRKARIRKPRRRRNKASKLENERAMLDLRGHGVLEDASMVVFSPREGSYLCTLSISCRFFLERDKG